VGCVPRHHQGDPVPEWDHFDRDADPVLAFVDQLDSQSPAVAEVRRTVEHDLVALCYPSNYSRAEKGSFQIEVIVR
jgi:hypothetical protein